MVDDGTFMVKVAVFPAAVGFALKLNVIWDVVVLADNVTEPV